MIIVVSWVEVRATGEGIGFVLFSWEVSKSEVVVCEAGNVASDTSIDMLGVAVIFQVLMVCIDCDRVGGSYQEMSPVGETTDEGQQLAIMDIVVAFCG